MPDPTAQPASGPAEEPTPAGALRRRLGVSDAVVIGLGAMLGAGVFASFAPAAAAAGSGLLVGLAIAAVVAFCNATSSARLAAVYPESGGTYVYARRRLGRFWGFQAGWSFVVGKTASCAAMALTFGSYVAPGQTRLVGILAVVALTALNYRGCAEIGGRNPCDRGDDTRDARGRRGGIPCGRNSLGHEPVPVPRGRASAASCRRPGLLFFAFAGYARVATLGEEVVHPRRTIPLAIPLALGIVLVVYVVVAVCALLAVGADGLAATSAPLQAVVEAGSLAALSPVVQVGAAVATFGALLALILGVSRTTMAMARDRELPGFLAAVHPRYQVPYRAELAVAFLVIVLVATLDVRGAIGFSSFGVLTYYAITNASALRLTTAERRPPRVVAILGLVGCLVLAFTLPVASVVGGAIVAVVGAVLWALRRNHRPSSA